MSFGWQIRERSWRKRWREGEREGEIAHACGCANDVNVIGHIAAIASPLLQGDVIAVGHSNGTVSITTVDGVMALGPGLDTRRDYAPRVARPCSEIAFNPMRPQLLAVGMAKMAKEPSLLLWDISARVVSLSSDHGKRRPAGVQSESSSAASSGARSAKSLGQTGQARTTGPTELSQGEGVLSLKWVPGSADVLLAGIGAKWLRLFDIRAKTNHTVSTARGAYCLTVDPLSPDTFASFSRMFCTHLYIINGEGMMHT